MDGRTGVKTRITTRREKRLSLIARLEIDVILGVQSFRLDAKDEAPLLRHMCERLPIL